MDVMLVTFAGEHTRLAILRMRETSPYSDAWMRAPVSIYVCQKTDEAVRNLRFLVNQNDTISDVFTDMDCMENIV